MKKLVLSFLVFYLLIALNSKAQQLPMYSQYMWNDYIINPAYTGALNVSPIQLTYRKQWMGFNGSPETYSLGGHTAIGKSMGLGGMLFKDDAGGAFSQIGGMLNYAYRIKLVENSTLSFGLSAEFNQYSFDANKINASNSIDVALQTGRQTSIVPDASFGILYQYKQKYKLGISAHQLVQSKLKKLNFYELETNRLVRHYNLLSSYIFILTDRMSFEPSVLLKTTEVTPIQVEVGARMHLNEFLWLGISYRHKDAVVALLGLQYRNIFIGYSYDATLSAISNYSSGSSEIVLAYKISKNGNKENSKLPLWYIKKLKNTSN